MKSVTLTPEDRIACAAVCLRVPGWSTEVHYAFFKSLLLEEAIREVLMLGVCHGRDICMMLDIHRRYRPNSVFLVVGVDKFDDTPCTDWPEHKRGESWTVAGFGPAPQVEVTRANINDNKHCVLIRSDDEAIVTTTMMRFDAIYVDTAHDYETVKRQLGQVPRLLRPGGILCGDDYSDDNGWGVKRAVSEAHPGHTVFGNWIWVVET